MVTPAPQAWDRPAALRALGAFADIFAAPGFRFGSMDMGESKDGVGFMPMYAFSPEAARFEQTCYEMGWVSPEVNWVEWMNTEEAASLTAQPDGLADATAEQLQKLLTVLIRQERFVTGGLAEHFESGFLLAILRRAQQLADLD